MKKQKKGGVITVLLASTAAVVMLNGCYRTNQTNDFSSAGSSRQCVDANENPLPEADCQNSVNGSSGTSNGYSSRPHYIYRGGSSGGGSGSSRSGTVTRGGFGSAGESGGSGS